MSNTANRILLANYLQGQRSATEFGRNFILNPSAFRNVNNTTTVGTTTRNTTNPITGISDYSVALGNNINGYIEFAVATLTNEMSGKNCEFSFDYTASAIGSATYAQVYNTGTFDAVASYKLELASSITRVSMIHPCGNLSNPTVVRITNTATNSGASTMNIANVSYGKPGLYQVSQAEAYGSLTYATTASCVWSTTSTSLANFAADTDCPTPSVTGRASAPSTKIPGITLNGLGAGEYMVVATFTGGRSGATSAGQSFGISDGTTTKSVQSHYFNTNVFSVPVTLIGHFSYTAAQSSVTFQIQGVTGNASTSATIQNDGGVNNPNTNFEIKVYRFPNSTQLAIRPDTAPASWSGYLLATDASWSTTSSTFADFGAGSSISLTQRTNRNFGTVAVAGSSLPGITFTPPRVGRYLVTASGSYTNTGNNSQVVRLTDGTTVLASGVYDTIPTAGAARGFTLVGIYDAANLSAVTLKLQGARNGGTMSLSTALNIAAGGTSIEWSITLLDAPIAAPLLVGSVTSNSSGATTMNWARISNNGSVAAITNQTGSWITSVSRTGTGVILVTFKSGYFAATPSCVCVPENSGVGRMCGVGNGVTPSTTSQEFYVTADNGVQSDQNISIHCGGF